MNEHSFVRSIHTALKRKAPELYVWKINDNFQGGVADAYYSGDKDHWVEYKYISLPKRDQTLLDIGLSPLQQQWLRDRHNEGRTVAVIVGSPDGNIILPALDWEDNISRVDFLTRSVDKSSVLSYIVNSAFPNKRD